MTPKKLICLVTKDDKFFANLKDSMSITLEINCDKMDSKIYQAIIKIVLNWKIENDKKTRVRIPDE